MKIAIIGSGWHGAHVALVLKQSGHEVTVFERNKEIFGGISGSFGIRIHAGPHYPRSSETRKNCRRCLNEFRETYPELVVPHEYAIYGLGAMDADGEAPKIDKPEFVAVAKETPDCVLVDLQHWPYKSLQCAINVDEPSALLGRPLREKFIKYLQDKQIPIHTNYTVKTLKNSHEKICISDGNVVFNVFDSSREILDIVNQKNILTKGDCSYIKGGVLDNGLHEITENPNLNVKNTCDLQTYQEIQQPQSVLVKQSLFAIDSNKAASQNVKPQHNNLLKVG